MPKLPPQNESSPATAPPPAAPLILIVDDAPANVLLLVRMLAQRGYNAKPVLSGKLALQAARAEPPDLILLDINMPEMNGYELCAQLKADPRLKEIPVIFISALSETLDKVKAFQVGGVDYVTKPFQFEEVYARIQTHLRLRRLEKLRDDLTHMVVHDLSSPLLVILGFLNVLERHEAQHLSASARKFVPLARHSAEELSRMISSILDVSKMETGELQLQCEPCDLAALTREVVATHQPLPGQRTVTLDAPATALIITADLTLLRRVLQNLLGNAIRHTPAAGTVRLAIIPADHEVCVSVTDDGPGIAATDHQRIFAKFGQIETHGQRQGTGLGLTFCQLAIAAHGGRIGIVSDVGQGSTFWFVLPIANVL